MFNAKNSLLKGILEDCKGIGKWSIMLHVFVIASAYGFWMANVVTPFELYSYKSGAVHSFLTYYFQNRGALGLAVLPFMMFNPYFLAAISLLFLFAASILLRTLFVRIGAHQFHADLGVVAWMVSPFFYGYSAFAQGMVVAAMAMCLDIIAMFWYTEYLISGRKSYIAMFAILSAVVCSFYEAHISLLLTGCLGILWFVRRENKGRILLDIIQLGLAIMGGVILWAIVHKVPILFLEKILGVAIPAHGGAHNTVFWVDGERSFLVNLKGFGVGILINWLYTSLFVYGLRACIVVFVGICLISFRCFVKQRVTDAFYLLAFVFSIFAFPMLQCSSSNFRTQYFFMPFLGFGVVILLEYIYCKRMLHRVVVFFVLGLSFFMLRETSGQYYYRWKVSQLDDMHWNRVVGDLWKKYGRDISKPVLFVGAFSEYPATWNDLRPNRHLPLLNNPFLSFSYFSSNGVAREPYIILAQKMGVAIPMPEYSKVPKLQSDSKYRGNRPEYPMDGYVYEVDDLIIVNLGRGDLRKFKYEDYLNDNERMVDRILHLDVFDNLLLNITDPIRRLAVKYPWVWNRRGGS